ncbi:prepilin peptidase [Actinomadura opuntiae]|uniref:prepilin peptidase n=1 Tax=Actinomadura sp. OS1-43 TaxID=604315 RepID=UPI00255B2173|nr:A24 family peptidase [Actinomadura sp. OS1-43]MDL4819636.1 A24 family peptidase [Actinomadura sp. OS1-43]
MVALVLLPVGLAAGLLLAPLAAPFVGDVAWSRRLAVGAVTAAVFGLIGWRVGTGAVLAALLYLAAVGTLLAFIDVQVTRLPDRFTLPSYGVVAALLAVAAPYTDDGLSRFWHALAGMAALFALFAVQALLVPNGIGVGDVKLAGVLGLCLGWFGTRACVTGVLVTYLVGGSIAVGVMIVRRTRKGEFPFGPPMLLGALVAVLAAAG